MWDKAIPLIRKVAHNDNPHHFKPLPLPVRDAFKFASMYGTLNGEKPEKSAGHKRSLLACVKKLIDNSKFRYSCLKYIKSQYSMIKQLNLTKFFLTIDPYLQN